jgi:hypothetical protein
LIRTFFRRLAQESADFWVLLVVPGLPSLLPWRAAWACYRVLARLPILLEKQTQEAAGTVEDYLPVADHRALTRRMRLLRMVDFADLFFARKTPVASAPEGHFHARGEWPAQAFIAVGFHYGSGMWMLRDLNRKGRRTVVVAAPFEPGDYKGRRVYLACARTRYREMERSAGAAPAYRPRVREKLLQALEQGDVVMSLLDLPPRLVPAQQQPIDLLGQPASLPIGVLQLAAAAGVPVVPWWVETDARGVRTLVIEHGRDPHDVAGNLAYFASLLDRLVLADPAAWNFWSEWPIWMRDAETLHARATAVTEGVDQRDCQARAQAEQ